MVPPAPAPPPALPRRYGKYELLERIGEGGMAEAFKARLPGAAGFEKTVVIKRILPHLAESPRFVKMFINEAKLAARIQHQNVVQVFELGEVEGGELFMAMEYVHGLDLRAILELAAEKVLRIPIWFSAHAMFQVLSGLAHAHELIDEDGEPLSIIHRDVTPSNVFVSVLGEIKLADFGVAKAIGSLEPDSTETTLRGQLKGKISYAPPEQIHGEVLDARADVFSAGVVLWECLTQRRLFGGRADFETMLAICEEPRTPPSAFNPSVPPELDAVVLAALEKDREDRFASARDFAAALRDVLQVLRPRLLPTDVRHVLEVLRGKKPVHPVLGADLPGSGSEDPRDSGEPVPLTKRRRSSGAPPMAPAPAQRVAYEGAPRTGYEGAPRTGYEGAPRSGYESQGVWMPEPPAGITDDLRVATPVPLAPDVRRATMTPTAPAPVPPAGLEALVPPARLDGVHGGRIEPPTPAPVMIPPAASTGRGRGGVDDLPRWEQEAEPWTGAGGHQVGATPFYARTTDGSTRGPLEYGAFIRMLEAKEARPASVSADGETWIPTRTFAALAGLEALYRERPRLKNVSSVGTLEETSLIALFTKLWLAGATGRLVVMTGANATARREIDVVRGAPSEVWTDRPDLQLPALAVRRELIGRERLPELVHRCLRDMSPLDEALRGLTSASGRYRPIFMRDRLVEVLRWRQGKFAFDSVPVESPPFSATLLTGLVDLVARAWTDAELTSRLEPTLAVRLVPGAEFEPIVTALELPKAVEAQLDKLVDGKSLAAVSRRAAGAPVLALGLVMLETGALRPR